MPAGHIYDDQSKLTLRLGIGLANALPVWTGHSFRPYQYGLDFRQPVPVSNQYAIFPLSRTNIPILHWGALRNDNRWSIFIGNKWNKQFLEKFWPSIGKIWRFFVTNKHFRPSKCTPLGPKVLLFGLKWAINILVASRGCTSITQHLTSIALHTSMNQYTSMGSYQYQALLMDVGGLVELRWLGWWLGWSCILLDDLDPMQARP